MTKRLSRILLLILPIAAGLAALCPVGSAASDLVQIQGLRSISGEQAKGWLKNQLTFIDSAGVSRARADDLAYFLRNALRDRGYTDANVDWRLEGEGETQRILLVVDEGQTSAIAGFTVTGNDALADDAVVELMTESTRDRLELGPDDRVPLVRADLRGGTKKIEQFYKLLGFTGVSASFDVQPGSEGTIVAVTVDEGIQSVVTEVVLPTATSIGLQKKFDAVRTDFSNRKLNDALVSNLTTRLRSLAVNSGYYEASVSVAQEPSSLPVPRDPENDSDAAPGAVEGVRLVATIEWGDPVSLAGVAVSGNDRVKQEFFSRHFGELVGHPYSPADTARAVDELLQTGAFETIRTDPVQQPDGTFLLDVEVEESYTRTLGIFGGATNYEGPVGGFEFRNLNLFGVVRTLDSRIELSRRGARGDLKYNDPWFLDTDIRFSAGVFGQNRQEEGYEKWETGGNYEFTKTFGAEDRNAISLFGRASYTEVQDSDIDPLLIGDTEYFVHFIGLSATHDRRDSPTAPRKGFIAQTSASVSADATGSDVEFFKTTGRLGFYHPVGNHNFRMGARAGTITPIGNTTEIPIDLRFFNGGPSTVRSFQERSLGARDPMSGYHIGGEFYTVFNLEYEVPIPAVDGLSLVAFGDAGNLLPDADDASLDDLRYALGLGLRYLTPIGPLRLEYGYNPDRRPGEPQGTLHFGFGFTY